MAGDDQISRFG